MRTFAVILAVVAMSACDVQVRGTELSDDKEVMLRETNLDGVIGGEPWSFRAGRVKDSAFGDERMAFEFWNVDEEAPCDIWSPETDRKIFGAFALEAGSFEISPSRSVTFLIESPEGYSNLIVTSGKLVIESITEEKVTGQLLAVFDESNEVNGAFELVRCQQ